MRRFVAGLILAFSAVTAGRAADPVPDTKAIVTIKDFDFFNTGNNPVGVAVDPGGDLKVGILGLPVPVPRASTPVFSITPDGESSLFGALPLATDLNACRNARPGRDFVSPGVQQEPTPFLTGLAYHRNGDLYVGLPNCDSSTHGIWRISPNGMAQSFATVPISQLPKGIAFTNGGFPLYVTDLHDFNHSRGECKAVMGTPGACTLRIWRIEQNGAVTVWKESPLFYGNPDSPLLHPHGVNGIVVDDAGTNVYVTVTDYGRIIRIPIDINGNAGNPQVVFEDVNYWGMDGITLGPDGNLYVVIVRTDQLIALHPDGTGLKVLVQGHPLDGPTQLAFGRRRGPWYPNMPPLYITNGSGARVFFYQLARYVLSQDNLLAGVNQLVSLGIQTADNVIDLHAHPSVVKVSLGR